MPLGMAYAAEDGVKMPLCFISLARSGAFRRGIINIFYRLLAAGVAPPVVARAGRRTRPGMPFRYIRRRLHRLSPRAAGILQGRMTPISRRDVDIGCAPASKQHRRHRRADGNAAEAVS